MNTLDQIGEQAAAALRSLDTQGEAARAAVQQIWDAFDEAKKNKVEVVINGAKSKTQWAAWSGQTIRNIQYVLRGKRDRTEEVKRRTTGSRPFALKDGAVVRVKGADYRVEDEVSVRKTKSGALVFTFVGVPVAETAEEKSPEKKSRPVKHLFSVHYCNNGVRVCGYGVKEQDGDILKGSNLDKPENAAKITCNKCRRVLGLFPLGKKAKTHAVGSRVSDTIAWTICGKDIQGVKIAGDKEKPTCQTCVNHAKYRYRAKQASYVAKQAERLERQTTLETLQDCPTPAEVQEEA